MVDASFPDPTLLGPDAFDDRRQRILNSKAGPGPWPGAPMHQLSQGVRVTVRLVWERDGVEYLDTIATHWGGLHVLVDITDRQHRYELRGVWLHCDDVGRR
jgi:hypothetical protein